MNKTLKIILIILGILILLGIVYFIWFDLNRPAMLLPERLEREGFDYDSYCEVQTINGTALCLPEGFCEFQEDSEGRKICLAKRV